MVDFGTDREIRNILKGFFGEFINDVLTLIVRY